MLDIIFYMKFDDIINSIKNVNSVDREDLVEQLDKIRRRNPIIYNIETTNRCNMQCEMCPRTTMMTRKIVDIDRDTFINIVNQIKPHRPEDWEKWKTYCEKKYGIKESDPASENHFFLYIISKVIQLHGYGDPLLDVHMDEYVKILHDKGFYSYFSCNPSNINLESTYKMLDAGVDYIKYSIESIDDTVFKQVRGELSSFSDSYQKIIKVLEYKKKNHLNTTIVITMIDLNRKNQKEDYDKLRNAFKGLDVYLYLKSENGQWYRKNYHETKSIHWSEICKHPWMTATIKSNGDVVMCPEDFNNELVFGNVKKNTLKEIWNGEQYGKFRRQHIDMCRGIKCTEQCDMKLIGELLR